MEPLTLISEIQPLAPTSQPGGHPRHNVPFTHGQFLQGVISGQQGPNQFTLDIGGQQLVTQSSAQLHVGQKLNLQVAALSPQVQLQIVPANTDNQRISSAIHLLGQQTAIVPELPALTEEAMQLPSVSAQAQETLQWFTDRLTSGASRDESTVLLALTTQLIDKAGGAALSSSNTANNQFGEIGRLLFQLADMPFASADMRERAAQLANMFASFTGAPAANIPPATAESAPFAPMLAEFNQDLQGRLERLATQSPVAAALLQNLPMLFSDQTSSPLATAIEQLVFFLAEMEEQRLQPSSLTFNGFQLETVFNRLGMNLEHLLAENKPDEAVRTLKHALLELSHQLMVAEKSPFHADQLVRTIELYQLLQIRLANESLFFLPLPFSLFQQGYLLIDTDNAQDQAQQNAKKKGRTGQNIAIHLQLEGLGNLEIDIHRDDERIALKFLAENGERAKYMAGCRDELDQWLTTGRLDSVQFLIGAKDPTKSLLEKLVHGATGMIDTTA